MVTVINQKPQLFMCTPPPLPPSLQYKSPERERLTRNICHSSVFLHLSRLEGGHDLSISGRFVFGMTSIGGTDALLYSQIQLKRRRSCAYRELSHPSGTFGHDNIDSTDYDDSC